MKYRNFPKLTTTEDILIIVCFIISISSIIYLSFAN